MIHQQSVFEPWPIESESVQAVICSPPYYALRKYSIPDVIIGGDKDCKHEFEMKQTFNKNHVQVEIASVPIISKCKNNLRMKQVFASTATHGKDNTVSNQRRPLMSNILGYGQKRHGGC